MPGAGGGRDAELLLNEYGASGLPDEKLLKIGCTTV